MATYKRISTKRGTRYQKKLATGQVRFVKKSEYDAHKGKASPSRKQAPKTSKKRGNPTAKKKGKGGRKGSRILGNLGIKGLVIGAGLLAGIKYLVRTRLPQAGAYTTGLSAMGAGAIAKAMNTSGKSLLGYGAVDAGSEFITDLVLQGGMVNLFNVGQNGGFDFG